MTRDDILCGTATTESPKRLLRAGKLEAYRDAGALRWIRWNRIEVMRGILFQVRTPGQPVMDMVAITHCPADHTTAAVSAAAPVVRNAVDPPKICRQRLPHFALPLDSPSQSSI